MERLAIQHIPGGVPAAPLVTPDAATAAASVPIDAIPATPVAGGGAGAGAGGGAGLRCVVFDFDSTLSTPKFLERFGQWAIADKPMVIGSMSSAELWANVGGAERVARLRDMLTALSAAGLRLLVCSLGFTECIQRHLDHVGLAPFFAPCDVIGQDSEPLRRVRHVKAVFIEELARQHAWAPENVLFVDDSAKSIEIANNRGSCLTFRVTKEGLDADDMEAILSRAKQR